VKLTLFLVADCANITADNKLNIMGVFQAINSLVFPTRLPSMHLVAILVPDFGEIGDRTLTIRLNDPDKVLLLELNIPFHIPPIVNGTQPHINTLGSLRDIVFEAPGTYEFVALVNDEQIGECPLCINQVTSL
jgi:hypothetical protein